MKNALTALISFALAAISVLYFLNSRDDARPRPNLPPEHAAEDQEGLQPGSAPLPAVVADRILIEKGARRLTLFCDGKPVRRYRVSLGFEPKGKKTTEGDGKTPEGCYLIDYRKDNSRYHRALHISYPNAEDRRQAAARGVSPGSDIMIHGLMNGTGWVGRGHLMTDWTLGCIAVGNREIDEICRLAPVGTKVEIVP